MDLPFPAMMNLHPDTSLFTVPITEAYHQVAQRFYANHSDSGRSKQVYLNTLSVQAVYFYMTCMGLKPDLDQGMSWNPTLQALMNVADLWIDPIGRLECCPVLPGMEAVPISAQATSDRVGYIAVRLNAELTDAELIGFIPSLKSEWIEAEQVPLTEWQSLDALPEHLSAFESAPQAEAIMTHVSELAGPAKAAATGKRPVEAIARLSEWVNDGIEAGWKTLDVIIEQLQKQSQPNPLAYGFRQPLSSPQDHQLEPDSVKRGKFLLLGDQPDDELLFLVGVKPSKVGSELNITVEVYPFESQPYLPQTIQLAVMDETGKAILQAEGGNSEGLEFQFSGEPGERFSVKVSVEGHQIIEQFQV